MENKLERKNILTKKDLLLIWSHLDVYKMDIQQRLLKGNYKSDNFRASDQKKYEEIHRLQTLIHKEVDFPQE